MKRILVAVLTVALTGCAAQMTLIDRADGKMYSGSTDGSTISGSGGATIDLEGEKYTGPWIYQPNGGSFGFSNFAGTTNFSGSANAFNPNPGFANTSFRGIASSTGSASAFAVSAVGNGMINVRANSGKFMRCIFSFNTLQNTGLGECLRSDGRTYDMTLKR